jgi:prepilin-type N-terminal cleavage/methylation domain-containing protein
MRRTQAFTLIEVLVVVVVLGIIAAVAIPKFAAARSTSAASATAAQFRVFEQALERYYALHGDFPKGKWEGWSGERMPDDLKAVFGADLITKPTPIGGHYGYVHNSADGHRTRLTLIFHTGGGDGEWMNSDREAFLEMDRILDDGNPRTGRFIVDNQTPVRWCVFYVEGTP